MSQPVPPEVSEIHLEMKLYVERGEVEVPARVLDMLMSFAHSSTKLEYPWNRPPYRKLARDGSYWEVGRLNTLVRWENGRVTGDSAVCVRVGTWTSTSHVCLLRGGAVYVYASYPKGVVRAWSHCDKTEVVLTSRRRDARLGLFEVCRKLMFYETLIELVSP